MRHPVTQFYLTDLQDTREFIKEGMATGQATYDLQGPEFRTYIGQCIGLLHAIEYARKDFEYAGKAKAKERENEDGDQSAGI
jgi:hypothetical protein